MRCGGRYFILLFLHLSIANAPDSEKQDDFRFTAGYAESGDGTFRFTSGYAGYDDEFLSRGDRPNTNRNNYFIPEPVVNEDEDPLRFSGDRRNISSNNLVAEPVVSEDEDAFRFRRSINSNNLVAEPVVSDDEFLSRGDRPNTNRNNYFIPEPVVNEDEDPLRFSGDRRNISSNNLVAEPVVSEDEDAFSGDRRNISSNNLVAEPVVSEDEDAFSGDRRNISSNNLVAEPVVSEDEDAFSGDRRNISSNNLVAEPVVSEDEDAFRFTGDRRNISSNNLVVEPVVSEDEDAFRFWANEEDRKIIPLVEEPVVSEDDLEKMILFLRMYRANRSIIVAEPVVEEVSDDGRVFLRRPLEVESTLHTLQGDRHFMAEPTVLRNGDRIYVANITHPGASFIKVHFSRFEIPSNAVVAVSNPDGTEVYPITMANKFYSTVDEAMEDDGVTSFSAMSIEGETAMIEVYIPHDIHNNLAHGAPDAAAHNLSIDSFLHSPVARSDESNEIDEIEGGDVRRLSTCGKSNLLDVECARKNYPDEVDRSSPVARLLVGGVSCTAWRVGPTNLVFSTYRCLASQKKIRSAELHFNFRRYKCGGRYSTRVVKVTGKNIVSGDYHLDYVLFSVNGFESIRRFGYQGLDPRIARQDEPIYIPQHPTMRPQMISIESDQNVGNRCVVDKPIWGKKRKDIGYSCDTRSGSSGSPVLSSISHNVIALHHYQGCPNQGVLFRHIWPKVQEYFGGIVPQNDKQERQNPDRTTPTMKVISGNCKMINSHGNTCVTSPNFPGPYGKNERCIIITSATGWINAPKFVTGPEDWFLLLSTYYSGLEGPKNVKTPAGTKFYWQTKQGITNGGWRACLKVEKVGAFHGNVLLRNQLRWGNRKPAGDNRRLQDVGEDTVEEKKIEETAPKSGKKAPKSGKKAPMSGKKAPMSGKKAPKSGKKAPESGKKAPKSGKKAPKSGKKAPKSEKKAPKSEGMYFLSRVLEPIEEGEKMASGGEGWKWYPEEGEKIALAIEQGWDLYPDEAFDQMYPLVEMT